MASDTSSVSLLEAALTGIGTKYAFNRQLSLGISLRTWQLSKVIMLRPSYPSCPC